MQESILHRGSNNAPLAVFIHGMGLGMEAWTDPAAQKIFLGRKAIGEYFQRISLITSFHDLKDMGFSVLAWTQRRPAGPISIAVDELVELLLYHKQLARNGLVIVGHSRGGLIARRFLEDSPYPLRMLITIGTPHQGSGLSDLAKAISPLTAMVNVMTRNNKDAPELVRAARFLQSRGFKELYTDSPLFSKLSRMPVKGSYNISIGGTNPDLLKAGRRSVAEILNKYLPGILLPDEMKDGVGDGLVTCRSAVLPYADEHMDFHYNHLALLFAEEVMGFIAAKAEKLV